MTSGSNDRGVILILVLLAMTFIASAGLGLALSSSLSRLSEANHQEALALTNAAEAALELAARELASLDLDAVLGGTQTSALIDGSPGSRTVAAGTTIDLVRLTNELSCGRSTCTSAQIRQSTTDRPWGPDNPAWRLFVHQPLAAPALPGVPRFSYVVVWIGDDARENDGDPTLDGAGPGQEGRYIVRARAEAFGARGGRRAVEAELVRRCVQDAGGDICLPGSRVQSWRLVTSPVS